MFFTRWLCWIGKHKYVALDDRPAMHYGVGAMYCGRCKHWFDLHERRVDKEPWE